MSTQTTSPEWAVFQSDQTGGFLVRPIAGKHFQSGHPGYRRPTRETAEAVCDALNGIHKPETFTRVYP